MHPGSPTAPPAVASGDARSFNRALDTLAAQAGTIGFDAVDYAFMPQVRTADGGWSAPDIASRNLPPRWQLGWTRYSAQDPYLWTCYYRNLPLDWDEVKDAGWLSEVQKRAIAYIDALGFLDGITVPIHLAGGSFAFVSGLSRERLGAWRAQGAAKEKLFVLAHTFHASVAQYVAEAGGKYPASLSPREREVLRHAAVGCSAPETARLLDRSPETVRRQRKSAMMKLGARTIAQAVAQAIALGLLGR